MELSAAALTAYKCWEVESGSLLDEHGSSGELRFQQLTAVALYVATLLAGFVRETVKVLISDAIRCSVRLGKTSGSSADLSLTVVFIYFIFGAN